MRALLRDARGVRLADVREPPQPGEGEVALRVVVAGVCRTDLYVADGLVAARLPVVLGHEVAGVIAHVGAGVRGLAVGARVCVDPEIACGRCWACTACAAPIRCIAPVRLGVERDGAFAERLVVPAAVIHRLPETLSFAEGAYVEPVAASLAVLDLGLPREARGLVWGAGRIAELGRRLLAADGFGHVELFDPARDPTPRPCSADFVVETTGAPTALAGVLEALRPRGTVVVKSRAPRPVELDLRAALAKEITVRAARYGSFARAIHLLAERRLRVDDLLGPAEPLEAFERVFAEARAGEARKPFFAVGSG